MVSSEVGEPDSFTCTMSHGHGLNRTHLVGLELAEASLGSTFFQKKQIVWNIILVLVPGTYVPSF